MGSDIPEGDLVTVLERAAWARSRSRTNAARDALRAALEATIQERVLLKQQYDSKPSYWSEQERRRQESRERVEARGFEEGGLQWLYRTKDVLARPYDTGETTDAICDALTREGCTAWPGDGTGCVEQMIRLQHDARLKAEVALEGAEQARDKLQDEVVKLKLLPLATDAFLEAEVVRLKAEVRAQLAAERAARQQLEEALQRFGKHLSEEYCPKAQHPHDNCTCGLTAALAFLARSQETP